MFQLNYKPKKRKDFLEYVKTLEYEEERIFNKYSIKVISSSFDIETTSTYNDKDEKIAFMYAWVFGINGTCTIGRTWEEFQSLLYEIENILSVDIFHRLVIYIHNLAFEFQFIKNRFLWESVFSLEKHEPLYALTKNGFEFRCSYKLSNYSLAKVGENLMKYKVKKLVGDLDYDLIRHSKTPLTVSENQYICNDCLVVMAYIQECIENDGGITKIPLTSTGYVRNYCRQNCLFGIDKSYSKRKKNFIRKSYNNLMKRMSLTVAEYHQLKRAFAGGFAHGNPFYIGKVLENVESMDFTSSYPFVMVSEQFPMSEATYIPTLSEEDLLLLTVSKTAIFDVEFINLQPQFIFDNIISFSKCIKKYNEGVLVNNGRVVSAKRIVTTMTDIDFKVVRKFYTWDSIRIQNIRWYEKGYLPPNFIKSILKLYQDKTMLKGVEGKEIEYLKSKGMINSAYGMCVTDIVRDTIVFDNEEGWYSEEPDESEAIEKYNNSKRRFLSYQWGVWTTAYARRNLFTGIYEFGEDYVYSDTDCIKALNFDKHKKYIDMYNLQCKKKLETVAETYKIDFDLFAPKTKKGKIKMLGVWDYEGKFLQFKTLGAKRYMLSKPSDEESREFRKDFIHNNIEYSLTVSGVNKNIAIPYLLEQFGDNIIKDFSLDNFKVPPEYTGKLTHTYIDYEQKGEIQDCYGIKGEYNEFSSVHLEKAGYEISVNSDFKNFLYSVQNINRKC